MVIWRFLGWSSFCFPSAFRFLSVLPYRNVGSYFESVDLHLVSPGFQALAALWGMRVLGCLIAYLSRKS